MSPILMGILASSGSAGITYRIQSLQTLTSNYTTRGFSIATDSSDNSYMVGYVYDPAIGIGNYDLLLVKYDSLGVIQWQRILGGTYFEAGYSIAIDSADNIYIVGESNSRNGGGNSYDLLLVKYNSSGTIQWERYLEGGTPRGRSVAIDSANNVYVTGFSVGSTTDRNYFLIVKYNSSGVLQWQRFINDGGINQGYSIATDSDNNVYAVGETDWAGSGSRDSLLLKYNSSGVLQWQRLLGGSGGDSGRGVAVDSANNIYIVGETTSSGTSGANDLFLAKYNSSGTLQWQRLLGGSANDRGSSVAIDSANNVYVFGYTASTGAGGDDFLLAKYNSSGTIQWQRVLGRSVGETGASITVDSKDNLYVVGYSDYNYTSLLAVLPNNGSLTGTYILNGANITYSASSLTAKNGSLTSLVGELGASTSSYGNITSISLTSANVSLTEYRVDL